MEFSGGSVVRLHAFTAGGPSFIPGWGTEIMHASEHPKM